MTTAQYIYAEQVSAPGSGSNASILTAKAVAQILLGSYNDAENSLREALTINPNYSEALAAKVALAELKGKKGDGEAAVR